MRQHLITILITAMSCSMTASAQTNNTTIQPLPTKKTWEHEVKVGVNMGGATPLPMPVEIRKIGSYDPKVNVTAEATATKWFGESQKWGISAGLKYEEKDMATGAYVKNYSMEILNDGNKVAGYWTGYVNTDYHTSLLTAPIMANYRINKHLKVRAGLYASVVLNEQFTGHVSNGYLREGTPVGEKLSFTDDNTASYDFTCDLRDYQWGGQLGATWYAYKHFTVNTDLTWAFNNIFEPEFKTISFDLYPIYLNVALGYSF